MTQIVAFVIAIAIFLLGLFHISSLNRKIGEQEMQVGQLRSEKIVLQKQVVDSADACNRQLREIQVLEEQRQAVVKATEPFLIRLDNLQTKSPEPLNGKSDTFVDRLNGLNHDLNRLLENNSR